MYNRLFNSRRGQYVIWKNYRHNIFNINEIIEYINSFKNIDRIKQLVEEEYNLFKQNDYNKLCNHDFWKKEDKKLLKAYIQLYNDFHNNIKASEVGSKNILSTNNKTCITTLQLICDCDNYNKLYVYQRSCDLSLGYLADLYTLYLFMKDYNIYILEWFIAIPHVYINNLDNTIKQFLNKEKIKMNFNIRESEKNEK